MADFARASLSPHPSNGSYFGEFNVTFITTRCYNISQEQRAPTSRHAILAFIVPVLLNFLELKYQGKDDSPFETYPKTMWVAITSLLMYCLAYDAELRFSSSHPTPTYARAVYHSMVLFGSLTTASLASILFPDAIRPFLYLFYILPSACELLQWIHQRIMVNHQMDRGHILPL